MNTAVFPRPETAWQTTSLPIMAYGMHSCWTADGCSKPQSTMALFNSFFNRKSLKPALWTPVYVVTLKDNSINRYQTVLVHLLLILGVCLLAVLLHTAVDVLVVRWKIVDQIVVVGQLLVILSLHL